MRFAKQIVARGGGGGVIQSAVWEKTKQVLDVNVSHSVPTLCLIQPGSGEPNERNVVRAQDSIIDRSH